MLNRGVDRWRRGRDRGRQSARLHRGLPAPLSRGVAPGCRAFCGGLAGYFGYDTVRHIEKKLALLPPARRHRHADIHLLHCEELAVIDNLSGKLHLMVYADPRTPDAYARPGSTGELADQPPSACRCRRRRCRSSRMLPRARPYAKADYLKAVAAPRA